MTGFNTSRKRKISDLSGNTNSRPAHSKTTTDIPWKIQCPAVQTPPGVRDGYCTNTDHPGVEDLSVTYRIRPGRRWADMKRYRRVELENMAMSLGDAILINRTDPLPEALPENATPEEILRYQRANMWIGRIQEIRADDPSAVFVRVFYWYWPEELPKGAEDYHGQAELILSNHADIIDATTISNKAPVSRWEEHKDGDLGLSALYWRQTFDLSKQASGKNKGLSELRKHCVCRTEYNPDRTMYECRREECATWNHAECLERSLRRELESRLDKGTVQSYLDQRAAEYAGGTITVNGTAGTSLNATEPELDADVDISFDYREALTPSPSKKKKQKKEVVRESNRFSISISNPADSGPVVAAVKLLPDSHKNGPGLTWTIALECLRCEKGLE